MRTTWLSSIIGSRTTDWRMPHGLNLIVAAVRQPDVLDVNGKHPAGEYDAHHSSPSSSRSSSRTCCRSVGKRALEFHPAAFGRMAERQPGRVQERTIQMRDGLGVAGHAPVDAAVERIAHNRMSDRAEVNANLVGAAGVNRDPRQRQHRVDPIGPDDARHGFAASPRARRHLLSVRRVASDRRVDPPSRVDFAPDERDVLLLDFPFAKLTRQLFMRRVVFRHDHQSGRSPIQPMDDTRPLLAADAAQIVDVVEQRVHERPARMTGRGMNDHAGGLVHHDEIVVLIQDRQRKRFGLRLRFDRFWN